MKTYRPLDQPPRSNIASNATHDASEDVNEPVHCARYRCGHNVDALALTTAVR